MARNNPSVDEDLFRAIKADPKQWKRAKNLWGKARYGGWSNNDIRDGFIELAERAIPDVGQSDIDYSDAIIDDVAYKIIETLEQAEYRRGSAMNPKKTMSTRHNVDDDDEVDIEEDERYDDVSSAIEEYVDRQANSDAAIALSTLSDQDMIDLEKDGYDDQTAVSIAYFGNEWAVDGDILVPAGWEKELGIKKDVSHPVVWSEAKFKKSISGWLDEHDYERVHALGGAWPGGMEIEIDADSMVQHIARENEWSVDFVQNVLDHMENRRKVYVSSGMIYQTSDNGDHEVYAKRVVPSQIYIHIPYPGENVLADVPIELGSDEVAIGKWVDKNYPNWSEWNWADPKRRNNPRARKRNHKSCGKGKIKIDRKAYTRKGYTDKRGRKVKATKVPRASYCVADRGRPGVSSFGAEQGRRKGTKPLIQKEGKLGGPGYTKKPVATRRKLLSRCVKRDGYKSCLGRLQAVLLSTELKPAMRRTWEADKAWLVKTYGGKGSVGPRKRSRKRNPEQGIVMNFGDRESIVADVRTRLLAKRMADGG